jgi:outer membrane autotransporter protein
MAQAITSKVTTKIRAGVCAALLSGTALVAPFAAIHLSSPALADCSPASGNVSCTGTTNNYAPPAQTNLNVTVQPGASVISTNGNDAIRMQNTSGVTSNTLTNNGTIDGLVTILSVNPGTDTFTNNGVLKITDPNTSLTSHSMAGATFVQSASGTFMARVDANGFNDGILTFDANLRGKLVIVVQPGIYGAPQTYTVVDTGGTLTGQFDTVTSSSPFFSVTQSVICGCVDVTLSRIAFNAVPNITPNQKTIGNILENGYSGSLDPSSRVGTFYSNILAANSITALDQLSGQGVTASQSAAFSAGSLFGSTMFGQGLNGESNVNSVVFDPAPLQYAPTRKPRGHEAFAALPTKAPPVTEQPGRWRVWTAGFGSDSRWNGDASAGVVSQKSRSYGGVIGVDHQLTRDLLIGVAAGGSETNFSAEDLGTSGRATGGHAGIYAVKTWNAFYAAASFSYARLDNSTTRIITGLGPTETATGGFASDHFGGRVELGWKQAYRGFTVTPFVAVEPSTLRQRGFTEASVQAGGTPGLLGLTFDARNTTSLPTFVGAQFDTRHAFANGWVLSPFARVSWVHEFRPDRQVSASFITLPTAAFTVDGARAASDSARLDTGAKLTMLPGKSLFANFTGEWSDRSRSYAAVGGFRAAW